MSRTVIATAVIKIHLDEDEIAAEMEGDNDAKRTEEEAIYALCLDALSPAETVDVKELTLHSK